MTKLLQWTAGLAVATAIGLAVPAAAQTSDAALNAKIGELSQAGKYADAIPLAQRLLALREKALGANHPNVAAALNDLAALYDAQGRYADAEALYKRALAIREKALGPNHPDVAQTLNNLANVTLSEGRYVDAEPLYQRALAIREKALGPDHADVAATLYGLGDLYRTRGRYAEAEPLSKRALAIREKALGPNNPAVAESLNSLALVYRVQGHTADAEPLFQRALAIREKVYGPDHPNVAQVLNNLANLYVTQRRFADAEPLYSRALAIFEKALGPQHPDLAATLNNLAALDSAQGRYADAQQYYMRVLAIRERALGPDHPDVGQALNNLANNYQRQRRYAEAEPLYKQSLSISEKTLGLDHPDVSQAVNNLAFLYVSEGHFADAEPLFKRALESADKTLGPDHPEVLRPLGNLAGLYVGMRRYADVVPLLQRMIASGSADPLVALQLLYPLQRTNQVPVEDAVDDGLNVLQRTAQTSAAAAITKLAVRLGAGNDRLGTLVRQDQDLAAETETLHAAILAAVSQPPSKRDAANEQGIRDRLAAIAAQREALQKVFAAEFPDYAALSNPLPMTAKDVQALLSDDEALLLYAAAGEEESFVFALTHNAFDWKRIPIGSNAMAQKVAAFRRGLNVEMLADQADLDASKIKRELFDLGVANALYTALIGPVEPLVKDKRHLIVVPFGPLTALPFHLLVTEKPAIASPATAGNPTEADLAPYRDAAWLIRRQAVSVMPSVASLKALRQFARKQQGAKPIVGFGDPVFSATAAAGEHRAIGKPRSRSLATPSYTDFWQGAGVDRSQLGQALPQLPDTADELKAVALKLGASSADIHLGRDASEATVKHAALADYRIVYFATHGLVAGDIKGLAEPSLVLTIPAQPSDLDDGLLTASEVAQLKLNADWVVLSACNTIAGDKPGAEALSGRARAFFYAGARAMLVSHWAVASDAATRLTTSTFDILKADAKLGRAEAIRRAMLAYLKDTAQPRNAYPAIWGPFSIIGEGAAR